MTTTAKFGRIPLESTYSMSHARIVSARMSGEERTSLHHRNIELQDCRRSDGLYDIEGEFLDVKHCDDVNADGHMRMAGQPLHRMKGRCFYDIATISQCSAKPELSLCIRWITRHLCLGNALHGTSTGPWFSV